MTLEVIPLGLIVLAILCLIVAALVPVSRAKAYARLLGSLCVGTGFVIDSVLQVVNAGGSWPRYFEGIAGALLLWVGLRKFGRDREGRTPAARIL